MMLPPPSPPRPPASKVSRLVSCTLPCGSRRFSGVSRILAARSLHRHLQPQPGTTSDLPTISRFMCATQTHLLSIPSPKTLTHGHEPGTPHLFFFFWFV